LVISEAVRCPDRVSQERWGEVSVKGMDQRQELRDFLVSRRGRLDPAGAGVTDGTARRVPGLRRGEVAAIAGVSVEYYSRLERGAIVNASTSVVESVARALQLSDAERAYLYRMVDSGSAASGKPVPRRPGGRWVPRAGLQWVLDSITEAPALVGNGRLDLMAGNRLGRAFYADMLRTTIRPANFARYQFLEPSSRDFYPEWDVMADMTVSSLRAEAGRDSSNKQLHDLVGELSTRSEEFRTRWARHDVHKHTAGVKRFNHHIVGELELRYELMELAAEDPGVAMTVYSSEPGSASAERMQLLASWAASEDAELSGQAPFMETAR